MPAEYVRVYGGWEERLNPNFQRQAWFRQRSRRLSSITPITKIEEAVRRSNSEESLLDTPPPPTPPRRSKPVMSDVNRTPRKNDDSVNCSEMNGKCDIYVNKDRIENNFKIDKSTKSSPRDQSLIYADDKFGRHPPLRKVTAVHCEVVADQTPRSHYKDVSHSSIYGVNGVKKLSLSSAELNFSPVKCPEQSFVTPRIDNQERIHRIQETYSPLKSVDQNFSRSLDQSYNSSGLFNQSQRSADSSTVSDQSIYNSPNIGEKVIGFGAGDYYFAVKSNEEIQGSECDDSSTLSDDDCTPHVSRSNSRGNEVTTKLRHLPPVHVESTTCFVRGRLKRKEERAAHRSRSLPPPPPYRPPPPATTQNRRAPITSYYLGDCSQSQRYIVTRTFMDEESYV